jgi:outer membrane lipoprotein-sorting protein
MKKTFIILLLIFITSAASASIKGKVIKNLKDTKSLSFNFEQNINDKIENGFCKLLFPKKIFCEYNLSNQKILVSNGKSVVIKTSSSYYFYPLKKTPLNLILNKDYLINKISKLEERMIDKKFINYNFFENDYEINIFFDYDNYNLIGWQTIDMYQNLSITFLSSIKKNQKLENNLFKLPKRN